MRQCISCGKETSQTVTYYGKPYHFEDESGLGDVEVSEIEIFICDKCKEKGKLTDLIQKDRG